MFVAHRQGLRFAPPLPISCQPYGLRSKPLSLELLLSIYRSTIYLEIAIFYRTPIIQNEPLETPAWRIASSGCRRPCGYPAHQPTVMSRPLHDGDHLRRAAIGSSYFVLDCYLPDNYLFALVDVDAGRGGHILAHGTARQVVVVLVQRAARLFSHHLVNADSQTCSVT